MKYISFSLLLYLLIYITIPLNATTYYMDTLLVHGNGTINSPFNKFSRIEFLLVAGDTLLVKPGTYNIKQAIRIRNEGSIYNPIVYKAFDPKNRPIINNLSMDTTSGASQNFRLNKSFQIIDGFICEGNYTTNQIISITGTSLAPIYNVTIKNCVVRRTKTDGVILNKCINCTIDSCEIYYCLRGSFNSQEDACGIACYNSRNTVISNSNIHHVSGDCIQSDPSYYKHEKPLWDSLYVENCKLWTSPLAINQAAYNATERPGENGIDSKTDNNEDTATYRPKIFISNVEAYGFTNDGKNIYIPSRAAFNIKHNVFAIIKNTILHDNEFGARLRGPYVNSSDGDEFGGAYVMMTNCITYKNSIANIWMERYLPKALFYNCTSDIKDSIFCTWDKYADGGVGLYRCALPEHFKLGELGYNPDGFDAKNCLFVNGSRTTESSDLSNVFALPSQFRNYTKNIYYPTVSNPCIDAGLDITESANDISGFSRIPRHYDTGAFEYRGELTEDPVVINPVESFYIQSNLNISETTVDENESECFNAIDSVIVAGGNTQVQFKNNSLVNLIAGNSIHLLPGFHAQSGSLVHAYITTDSTYCDGKHQRSTSLATPVTKSQSTTMFFSKTNKIDLLGKVKVYPNPNNGQFIIKLISYTGTSLITVANLLGTKLYQTTINESGKSELNLSHFKKGIYFVSIKNGNLSRTNKIIIQ